ncbi:MAG: mechanosensitive ion channel family protein [Leucobacter sp.]
MTELTMRAAIAITRIEANAADAKASESAAQSFYEANSALILTVVTIVLTALVTWVLVRIARRITANLVNGAQASLDRTEAGTASHLSKQQLLRRVRTMSKLITNTIVWVQVAIAMAIIFSILGVNITAIFASAGVVAAALTFSAQTILKDIITGLFFIAEDQIDIGDVVDVGFGLGVVESVSLRVTQVRGFDGFLWSVRNGEIVRTSNRSRGWLRLLLEIDFTLDSDIELAKETVLRALSDALTQHAAPHEVQATPTCWGLPAFNGYGYRLKFQAEYSAQAFDRLDSAMHEAAFRAIRAEKALTLALVPAVIGDTVVAQLPPSRP